ncbi:Alpha/beta hydrolase fold-3 [Dactylonectria estremocensis]|uniref:Alpha/beta hydrolase fold-3 n=1 Tax=Dactylonectria estremocensis TaxID=1079267 RepID=A0A9P9EN11_9HYPO|nr:Alpha/beta hydrolase fold-3 [Dactylonectria estremocensis]
MPSQESQAMEALYRRLNDLLASPGISPDIFGLIMEETATVSAEPTDVTYDEVQCPGTVRPAIWCKPLSASPSRVILYIHGGGFTGGSPACHRKLAAHLAKRAGCHAIVIDYRRSPEHQFPKQIDDVLATYDWLVNKRGIASKQIAFAGDSAGANLTVAVSLAARNRGLEVPASIIAFSPWIDMKLTSTTYQTHAHTDALVVQEAMQGLVGAYVGDASLDEPLIDLIHADLKGLPPMYITAGTAEVLQDDATRLADNARSAGVEVHVELVKDMQHVWVFMAGNAPEADSSLARAAAFIHSKFK